MREASEASDDRSRVRTRPTPFAVLVATWRAFNEDKVQRLAAAIAFSTIFAIAPLVVVLVAIVGGIVATQAGAQGGNEAEAALLDAVRRAAGADTATFVQGIAAAAVAKPHQGVIAQTVAWGVFAFGAVGFFAAVQDALNSVWGIEIVHGGWRTAVRDRLASAAMILVAAVLLLTTLAVNGALAYARDHFVPAQSPFAQPALAVAGQVASLVIVALAFACVFKVLPDVDIRWRDVWIGAAVTAVLFVAGEAGIAWYLVFAGVSSAYGAAGSAFVVLLWIYYSAIVLLVGAEFTKVTARDAHTRAPAAIRTLVARPAGADPLAIPATAAGSE